MSTSAPKIRSRSRLEKKMPLALMFSAREKNMTSLDLLRIIETAHSNEAGLRVEFRREGITWVYRPCGRCG